MCQSWGKNLFDMKSWSTVNRSQRPQSKSDLCNSYWNNLEHGHSLAVSALTQYDTVTSLMLNGLMFPDRNSDGMMVNILTFLSLFPFFCLILFLFFHLLFPVPQSFFFLSFKGVFEMADRGPERWGRVEVERKTVRKKERIEWQSVTVGTNRDLKSRSKGAWRRRRERLYSSS